MLTAKLSCWCSAFALVLAMQFSSCGSGENDASEGPTERQLHDWKPIGSSHAEDDSTSVDTVVFVEPEPDTSLIPIPFFEAFCQSLPASGTAVEAQQFFGPGNYETCDTRCFESTGEVRFTIYRLAATGQIVQVTEEGAGYCQGDGEYCSHYWFDANGYAAYSWSNCNDYVPTVARFYQSGVPVLEVVDSPWNDGVPTRTIRPVEERDTVRASDFVHRMAALRQEFRDILHSVENPTCTSEEVYGDLSKQMQQFKANLERSLAADSTFQPGWSYYDSGQLANSEHRLIRTLPFTALNAPLKAEPNAESATLDYVSYYNDQPTVIGTGPLQTIKPLGTHHWLKVEYWPLEAEAPETAWVFGAFMTPVILPEQ